MTEYITVSQAQSEFGLSRNTLIRAEQDGLIPGEISRTPGGHRRYTREQLNALMSPNSRIPEDFNYREIGTTGLTRFGGQVLEERLRELQGKEGRRTFREMRLHDPVISALFFALNQSLFQMDKRVKPASDKPADKEAAEFVESCFDDMSWSWLDQMTFITDPMFEQGFSYLEVVYKRRLGRNPPMYVDDPAPSKHNDGRDGWRKWAPRPAESMASGREWEIDPQGGIQGMWQQPEHGEDTRLRFIPISKALHFRTTVHPANNPEGVPIHRPAYRPWYFSTNFEEIEGIAVERNTQGIPVIYLGDGTTVSNDPNSDWSIAKNLVTNIRWDEQEGIVFPHPKLGMAGPGRGILFEFASANARSQWDVSSIIERLDKRKAVVVLAQWIMLGMDSVGSFALMQGQGDMFTLGVKGWGQKIEAVINRHGIPDLIDRNVFPDITGYPELRFGTVGVPNLKDLATAVNQLVEKEILTPDPELERHLRQAMNLPQPQPTEVKQDIDISEELDQLKSTSLAYQRAVKMGVISDEMVKKLMKPLLDKIQSKVEQQTGQEIEDEAPKQQSPQDGSAFSQQHEQNLKSGVLSIRVARQQLLQGGLINQEQFNELELNDGRLPNGQDVIVLFNNPEFDELLDLGVIDPTNIIENDPADMLVQINAAIQDTQSMLFEGNEDKVMLTQAIAALEMLSEQYQQFLAEETVSELQQQRQQEREQQGTQSEDGEAEG